MVDKYMIFSLLPNFSKSHLMFFLMFFIIKNPCAARREFKNSKYYLALLLLLYGDLSSVSPVR